jgi:dipeptidyl aminopeptidase/acylaminoacyl peptidase
VVSERQSFDDWLQWADGRRNLMVFSSGDDIYVAEGGTKQRLTREAGVKAYPSLLAGKTHSVLLYRNKRDLKMITYPADSWENGKTIELGDGEEARISPAGQTLAVVLSTDQAHTLVVQPASAGGLSVVELHRAVNSIIRNPRFSPDGRLIAFHQQDRATGRWDLWVTGLSPQTARKLASNIVAEESFRHVGPAWSPNSGTLWYFDKQETQGHHPLKIVRAATGDVHEVPYFREVTTAGGIAICPDPRRPMIAFCGHLGPSRDVFVLVVNKH